MLYRAAAVCSVTAAFLLGGCATQPFLPAQPDFSTYLLSPRGEMPVSKSTKLVRAPGEAEGTSAATVYTPPQVPSRITQPEPISCLRFYVDAGATQATDAGVLQQIRDACIIDLKKDIDDAYIKYEQDIYNNISYNNFGLDTLAIAASGATTPLGGAAAKVLSGISGFSNSVKSNISQDLLYTSALRDLLLQIEAGRAKVSAQIALSMTKSVSVYPLEQAKLDLGEYFKAGTLITAIISLSGDTGTAANNCKAANTAAEDAVKTKGNSSAGGSKTEQSTAGTMGGAATTSDQCNKIAQEVVNFKYTPTPTSSLIEAFWRPNDVFSDANEKVLSDCINAPKPSTEWDPNKFKLPNGKIAIEMFEDLPDVTEADRQQVMNCAVARISSPPAPAPSIKTGGKKLASKKRA